MRIQLDSLYAISKHTPLDSLYATSKSPYPSALHQTQSPKVVGSTQIECTLYMIVAAAAFCLQLLLALQGTTLLAACLR